MCLYFVSEDVKSDNSKEGDLWRREADVSGGGREREEGENKESQDDRIDWAKEIKKQGHGAK